MTEPKTPATSGKLTHIGLRRFAAVAALGAHEIQFWLPPGPVFVLDEVDGQRYVLPGDIPTSSTTENNPAHSQSTVLDGKGLCWALPESPFSSQPAWMFEAEPKTARVSIRLNPQTSASHGHAKDAASVVVTVHAPNATLTSHAARPHADVDGCEYALEFEGGRDLADAMAGFYWGTMLPCVVERTTAADYPDASGYVISTLADKYVGTYPDVDHEFQIKGRLAAGSAVDLHVVRRMMELQFRMMREDPCGLWRDPCAVQPSGDREYHVRRNSMDRRENAVMFLITGNVEVVESVWLYVGRTGDFEWLRRHIEDLEGALSCVEGCIDPLGRLWSDVYYEDQVIKDGRETMAAALAIRSFELMGEMERLLKRSDRAEHYRNLAAKLAEVIAKPLPLGCWDETKKRFIDWVDRSGNVHDHIHLLANELPVMFGAASKEQTKDVLDLLRREEKEFQRFPSFLAARVQDYNDSEIGDGGPYDLCAAGRYWCWDAAFWSWRGRRDVLLDQLRRVAKMGKRDEYVMGERYDMNHVYYRDGPPWHGAAHYYEYPCVFTWVLVNEYLGVKAILDAAAQRQIESAGAPDMKIVPRLVGSGSVTLRQEAYQLHYEYSPTTDASSLGQADQTVESVEALPSKKTGGKFTLRNLASNRRMFELDLEALFPHASEFELLQDCSLNRLSRNGSFRVELDSGNFVVVLGK